MALKTIYEKKEDIPEQFQELFTERDGKFELTGIEGVKTQSDVDRVQEALRKEKEDHGKTKDTLRAFSDLDAEQVAKDLDELAELRIRVEANKTGTIDEDKIDQLVSQRVAREKAPIERDNKRLTEENEKLTSNNGDLQSTITSGTIETEIRKAAEAAKVVPTAIDDIVAIGRGVFEVSEDGNVVTRDNVGSVPGIGVDVYLTDMKEKRPHWWPASQGGGANGGEGGGGTGTNPWSMKDWNLTAQGLMVREQGVEKATQMAKAANSHLGATSATAKKDAA